MKSKSYLALVGTAAAMSLAVQTFPLNAADQTTGSTGSTFNQTTTSSDKTLGHVERADKLIGKAVYGSDNQKLGKIDNLIVDFESGRILYAVIKTGTIGGRDFAVAPGVFTDISGANVHMNIDKSKLEAAPEFTRDIDKPDQWGQASFVDKVYQHFGQNAWWQGAKTAANAGEFHNVHKANDVIGMKVKNVNNEDLGKIDNVMVDLPNGRVVYAILSPDSSLNLGDNLYALPPEAFTLSSDHKNLVSDLNKDKLSGAPHFAKNQWPNLSNPAFASKVYQYYGKQPYFGTGSLQPTGRSGESGYKNKNN
jgi:sporulation protein YlmC with PRC-barrel domain